MPPSSTFFTVAPHWQWWVILYFFAGGIAGGSYFLAALLDLFGDERDRPLSRLGYLVAFPAVLLCAPLLIIDLNRPERFWHMLFQSERLPLPVFKLWSPMSVGSWALTIFGAFALVSFLGTLTEMGVIRWGVAHRLNDVVRRGRLSGVFALVGSAFGFFLASYTGVLLAVTNRPIWADTSFLGLLFLTSAGSTAAALLYLLALRRRSKIAPESIQWLEGMDRSILLLELVTLILMLISLGAVAPALLTSIWGILLLVGVLGLGILVPLALQWRPRLLGGRALVASAVLSLLGGFILRTVIVMSSEVIPKVALGG
jgi:protein NrfD